jgi:hypothetical protein
MRTLLPIGAALGLLVLSAGHTLIGSPAIQKTKLTFSHPVSVPGVVLIPGSYYFKLVDTQGNRNIVQVTNLRGNKLYATVLTIPDYRVTPTSHTVITFGEAQSGAATPIKAWFYPGRNFGFRFVYPKSKAMEIAKSSNQPVPEIPDGIEKKALHAADPQAPAVVALYHVPIMEVTPDKKEVEYQPQLVAQNDDKDQGGFDAVPEAKAP